MVVLRPSNPTPSTASCHRDDLLNCSSGSIDLDHLDDSVFTVDEDYDSDDVDLSEYMAPPRLALQPLAIGRKSRRMQLAHVRYDSRDHTPRWLPHRPRNPTPMRAAATKGSERTELRATVTSKRRPSNPTPTRACRPRRAEVSVAKPLVVERKTKTSVSNREAFSRHSSSGFSSSVSPMPSSSASPGFGYSSFWQQTSFFGNEAQSYCGGSSYYASSSAIGEVSIRINAVSRRLS